MKRGDQTAALYGPIRPRTRDRTGDVIDADDLLGSPALPRLTRRERLQRLSPVEWTRGELTYMETLDQIDDDSGPDP